MTSLGSPTSRRRRVIGGGGGGSNDKSSSSSSQWMVDDEPSSSTPVAGIGLSSTTESPGLRNPNTIGSSNPYIEEGDYYDDDISDNHDTPVVASNYKISTSKKIYLFKSLSSLCLRIKFQLLRISHNVFNENPSTNNCGLEFLSFGTSQRQTTTRRQRIHHHRHDYNWKREPVDEWIDIILLVSVFLSFGIFVWMFALPMVFTIIPMSSSTTTGQQRSYYFRPHSQLGRPSTDRNVNNLPILIPRYDINVKFDAGGWLYHRQFYIPEPPPNAHQDIIDTAYYKQQTGSEEPWASSTPDYGEIKYQPLPVPAAYEESNSPNDLSPSSSSSFVRVINPMDYNEYEKYRNKIIKPSFDHPVPQNHLTNEDIEDTVLECKRPSWIYLYRPNCNIFHDVHIETDYNLDYTYASVIPPKTIPPQGVVKKKKAQEQEDEDEESNQDEAFSRGTFEINDQVTDSFYIR